MKNGIGVFIVFLLFVFVISYITYSKIETNLHYNKIEADLQAKTKEEIIKVTKEIIKAEEEITEMKEHANKGPQMLKAIANMEASYRAEIGNYIAVDEYDSNWYKLGFDINPNNRNSYYTFEVISDGESFVAKAILKQELGDAKINDYITIDELDNKTCSSPELQALVTNWH